MTIHKEAIIEKAKNTPYKHKSWFLEGGLSVYDAMKYYAESGDFYIDKLSSIKYLSQIPAYKGSLEVKSIVKWLIDTEQWDKLVLRYSGKERGSDRGKLKLQTYLILKGYYNKTVTITDKHYSVILDSCGNIDYGQNPYVPLKGVETETYYANTIPELQKAVRKYIETYNLGGSQFSGGVVMDKTGKEIGRISYNGRYWEGDVLKLEYPG